MATEPFGVYAIPMRNRFRGITVREGLVLRGAAGFGEFCPFADYGPAESAPWLRCALESAERGWPEPVRERIPVNCTIPVVDPETAERIAAESGASTAKVKVADPRSELTQDLDRVAAVRSALGPRGAIRVDANAAWCVEDAVSAITALTKAAGGLEYAEQPCAGLEELAEVRKRTEVPIAADESIRRAEDPLRVAVAGAADIAVLKVAPLGGVRPALEVAEACGLPCVVSSAVESSIGLAAGLALAGALPRLDYACGLGTASLLTGDLVTEPLLPRDGSLPVLREPQVPDPALLREFQADEKTAKHWRARLAEVQEQL